MVRYDAFLLRIWRGDGGDDPRWAGRLEHLPDGRCLRFHDCEDLLAHLSATLQRGMRPRREEEGDDGSSPAPGVWPGAVATDSTEQSS